MTPEDRALWAETCALARKLEEQGRHHWMTWAWLAVKAADAEDPIERERYLKGMERYQEREP